MKYRIHVSNKALPETLTVSVIVIVVFIATFYPIFSAIRRAPPDTTYVFAYGFTPDYYQFISWIRDGMNGTLVSPRYIPTPYPSVFIHPFFTLLGIVGNLAHTNPFLIYLISRFLALAIFLFTFFLLIKAFRLPPLYQVIAFLFFVTATGFWQLSPDGASYRLIDPLLGFTNTNVLGKFTDPPHHILALSGVSLVALFCSWAMQKKIHPLPIILVTVIIGFLNPTTLIVTLGIELAFLLYLLYAKQIANLVSFSLSLLAGAFVLLYHFKLFQTAMPWSYMYLLMKQYKPAYGVRDFLLWMGPLYIIASIGVLLRFKHIVKTYSPLIIWGYFSTLLVLCIRFVPINFQRMTQFGEFIPLSILASVSIWSVAEKLKRVIRQELIVSFLTLSIVLYGFGALYFSFQEEVRSLAPNLYNLYIPNSFLRTLVYLSAREPKNTVILSGDYMSSIIPAFTNFRTVIGKSDVNPNYTEMSQRTYDFFDDKLSVLDAKEFLQINRVSFVIYGADTRQFDETKSSSFPFLKEVLRDTSVSLVQVIP